MISFLWVGVGLAVLFLFSALMLRRRPPEALSASQLRNYQALKGENEAEQLLEDEGFTILERQVRGHWDIYVNDEPVTIELRADLLVSRGDEVFVAEVKTGRLAPDPTFPPTRRQLLEYHLAFDVDGVILVSPERQEITFLDFPCRRD